MMADYCPPTEELAEILSLAPDDDRRRHVDECPRCRTLARRYRDFLSPAPLPPEADAEAAGRALRERLTVALPELAPALEGENRRAEQAASAGPRFGWRPSQRSMRPLLAVAAVLVCCLGLVSIRGQLLEPRNDRGTERPVLRGDVLAPAALTIASMDQGYQFAWGQPLETDATQLVLIGANLDEIGRIEIGTTGTYDLAQPPAGARYVRIEFLVAGDVVASTRTLPLAAAP